MRSRRCAVQNRGITLRASVCKPRIRVQDGKIEISQTLSQQRPLETILENTRISSFWFTFSELIIFLMFYLWPASKPPKNILHLLPWQFGREPNTMTISIIHNWMTLSWYPNVTRISKDSDLNFFFFYPLNQFIATLTFAYFKQRKSLPGTWLSI